MGRIVEFKGNYKSSSNYQEQLIKNIKKLNEIETDLTDLVIKTATEGKWKKWSDSMQEGDVFTFTEEMLKDTGDENVNNISSLIDEVIKVKDEIKNGLQ